MADSLGLLVEYSSLLDSLMGKIMLASLDKESASSLQLGYLLLSPSQQQSKYSGSKVFMKVWQQVMPQFCLYVRLGALLVGSGVGCGGWVQKR